MAKKTVAKKTIGCMGWEQDLCVLPEAESQMFTPALDTSADLAVALLINYSFDLGGYSASELVELWQKQYPGNWLHLAVIEALYQGRYKAISVQQILTCWQRRGQAIFHFNMEFERLICSKFPQSLTAPPALPSAPVGKKGRCLEEVEIGEQRDKGTQKRGNSVREEKGTKAQRNTQKLLDDPTTPAPDETAFEASTGSRSGRGYTPSPHPPLSHKTELLPVATNNPPIGQFTPEPSIGSESFTSKLKAMFNEKQLPSRKLLPEGSGSSYSKVEIQDEMSH